MSSILKALRRLEEERARKSHVAPEIAVTLLRDGYRRRQPSVWIWPIVFAFVALILTALLWLWRSETVKSQQIALAAPSSTANPGVAPERRGSGVIIEEVIDQRRPVLLPPAVPVSTSTLLPAKVNPPPQEMEVSTPTEMNKPTAAYIEERQTPVVSAIAWQADSSARMAVVDGLPVMTGESVGMARIQEILRDRILFVEEGVRFFVRMQSQ